MKRLLFLVGILTVLLSAGVYADETKSQGSLDEYLSCPLAGSVEENRLLEESFKRIPVLEINIDETQGSIEEMNADPEHNTKCHGQIRLLIPEGYSEEYTGKLYEELTVEEYPLDYIRGRGNSTWGKSKKPYRIKLDKKADLLGMGEEKNWVLLANYFDLTMMRNRLTYALGSRLMPEGSFTPESAYVNVVMNGRYLGLYCLTEQVRIGEQRLNIADLESEEDISDEETLSGGYLLSMELFNPDGRVFKTPRNSFLIESPESGTLTEEEYVYISGYLNELEQLICSSEEGPDEAFKDLLDIDSYIDFWLIQEFSGNGDAYSSDSTYLYKERNGKLYFGPLWDFDYVAWGGDNAQTEGFRTVDDAPWLVYLLKDESFRERLTERWEVLKELIGEAVADGGVIDRMKEEIYAAQLANYSVASSFLWDEEPGEEDESGLPYGETTSFDSETERLKGWILARLDWMDAHFPELRAQKVHLEFRDGDTMIEYKTLDRSEQLTENLAANAPRREGMRFTGWFRKDESGNLVPLSADDVTETAGDIIVYQAGWEEFDPQEGLEELGFGEDSFTLGIPSYTDLSEMVVTVPADFEKEYLEYSMTCEPEDCAYLSDGYLSTVKEGKVQITVSCGSMNASCEIIITEQE